MKFDVIILAGGLGTRLSSVVKDVPKPMATVGDRPFMDHLLANLPLGNIHKIILAVGHKYEVIEDYYGDAYENVKLEYSIENEPLGTGGGIAKALQLVESETCLILNGDTYFDVNYEELWQVHLESGKLMTLALKYMENPDRYGTVLLEGSEIVKFQEKQVGLPFGIINGGIYWVNKALLEEMPKQKKFSFESEVLENKVTQNKLVGYISQGLFIDIGIPEDYARAQEIFAK